MNLLFHGAKYFPGATPDIDNIRYEEEFQKGLGGESDEFQLVGQAIWDRWVQDKWFCEFLYRGGRVADTAPVDRLASMTDEEEQLLLKTTLRKYGHMANCTVNILSMRQLQSVLTWARDQPATTPKIIVEVHERIQGQLTCDLLQDLKEAGIKVWADDLSFRSPDDMKRIRELLPALDGVKIGTMDLARAFQVPVIKNPVDNPSDPGFIPEANDTLRHNILQFLRYLNSCHPEMKVVLELAIPLDDVLPPDLQGLNLFIQGGREGARAYILEPSVTHN